MTNEEIAVQLQTIIERGRQTAEKRKRQEELDAIAREKEEAAEYAAYISKAHLPGWMNEYLRFDRFSEGRGYRLTLPGCAPIEFGVHRLAHAGVRVYEPRSVFFDDEANKWGVGQAVVLVSDDNLDEAIALAADFGESWHTMKTEADRRNAEGIRPELQPEPTLAVCTTPLLPPPPIERIAVALERIADRLAACRRDNRVGAV